MRTTSPAMIGVLACAATLVGCTPKASTEKGGQTATSTAQPAPATLTIKSPAFAPQGEIPKKHTCEGDDVSPALSWSKLPAGTKSVVLIVDDPDAPDPKAPKMIWVHWVLYNLPADSKGLDEAVKELPAGTKQGNNDWKRTGYGGPCPPVGRHRYFHKVYALDTTLPDLGTPTKAAVEKAMQGHVIGKGELIGTYEKTGVKETSSDAAAGDQAAADAGAEPGKGEAKP